MKALKKRTVFHFNVAFGYRYNSIDPYARGKDNSLDGDPERLIVHGPVFKSKVRGVSGILQKLNAAVFVWEYVVRQDASYDACKTPSAPFLVNRGGQVVQLLDFENEEIKIVVVVTPVTTHILIDVAIMMAAGLAGFRQARVGYGKERNTAMVDKHDLLGIKGPTNF